MQRTHLHRDDLDWLPRSFKVLRWTVAGAVWTGAAALVGGVGALLPGSSGVIGGASKGLIVAGLYAGDRTARAVLRARLGKLARGQIDVARLQHTADGELVHVRGRVRAREVVRGLVYENRECVYRRVHLQLDQLRLVHESAVDFSLVDERGESIIVEVAGARLVGPEPKLQSEPHLADQLLALPLPAEANRWVTKRSKRLARGKKPPRLMAGEVMLRDGDLIEVLGYKNRTVDIAVEARLERDTPLRATLRAGRDLPLILSPVDA